MKKSWKKMFILPGLAVGLSFGLLFSGCTNDTGDTEPEKKLESISIEMDEKVEVGASAPVTVSASYSDNTKVTVKDPVFSVDNKDLAEINEGKLSAKKVGKVTVTAKYSGKEATKTVQIVEKGKASQIQLTFAALFVKVGEGVELQKALLNEKEDITSKVTLKATPEGFVKIEGKKITGVKEGDVTIYGEYNGAKSQSVAFVVLGANAKMRTVYVSKQDYPQAPSLWVWQKDGKDVFKDMGYAFETRPKMTDAEGTLKDSWWQYKIPEKFCDAAKGLSLKLNNDAAEVHSTVTGEKTFIHKKDGNLVSTDAEPKIVKVKTIDLRVKGGKAVKAGDEAELELLVTKDDNSTMTVSGDKLELNVDASAPAVIKNGKLIALKAGKATVSTKYSGKDVKKEIAIAVGKPTPDVRIYVRKGAGDTEGPQLWVWQDNVDGKKLTGIADYKDAPKMTAVPASHGLKTAGDWWMLEIKSGNYQPGEIFKFKFPKDGDNAKEFESTPYTGTFFFKDGNVFGKEPIKATGLVVDVTGKPETGAELNIVVKTKNTDNSMTELDDVSGVTIAVGTKEPAVIKYEQHDGKTSAKLLCLSSGTVNLTVSTIDKLEAKKTITIGGKPAPNVRIYVKKGDTDTEGAQIWVYQENVPGEKVTGSENYKDAPKMTAVPAKSGLKNPSAWWMLEIKGGNYQPGKIFKFKFPKDGDNAQEFTSHPYTGTFFFENATSYKDEPVTASGIDVSTEGTAKPGAELTIIVKIKNSDGTYKTLGDLGGVNLSVGEKEPAVLDIANKKLICLNSGKVKLTASTANGQKADKEITIAGPAAPNVKIYVRKGKDDKAGPKIWVYQDNVIGERVMDCKYDDRVNMQAVTAGLKNPATWWMTEIKAGNYQPGKFFKFEFEDKKQFSSDPVAGTFFFEDGKVYDKEPGLPHHYNIELAKGGNKLNIGDEVELKVSEVTDTNESKSVENVEGLTFTIAKKDDPAWVKIEDQDGKKVAKLIGLGKAGKVSVNVENAETKLNGKAEFNIEGTTQPDVDIFVEKDNGNKDGLKIWVWQADVDGKKLMQTEFAARPNMATAKAGPKTPANWWTVKIKPENYQPNKPFYFKFNKEEQVFNSGNITTTFYFYKGEAHLKELTEISGIEDVIKPTQATVGDVSRLAFKLKDTDGGMQEVEVYQDLSVSVGANDPAFIREVKNSEDKTEGWDLVVLGTGFIKVTAKITVNGKELKKEKTYNATGTAPNNFTMYVPKRNDGQRDTIWMWQEDDDGKALVDGKKILGKTYDTQPYFESHDAKWDKITIKKGCYLPNKPIKFRFNREEGDDKTFKYDSAGTSFYFKNGGTSTQEPGEPNSINIKLKYADGKNSLEPGDGAEIEATLYDTNNIPTALKLDDVELKVHDTDPAVIHKGKLWALNEGQATVTVTWKTKKSITKDVRFMFTGTAAKDIKLFIKKGTDQPKVWIWQNAVSGEKLMGCTFDTRPQLAETANDGDMAKNHDQWWVYTIKAGQYLPKNQFMIKFNDDTDDKIFKSGSVLGTGGKIWFDGSLSPLDRFKETDPTNG